MVIAFFVEKPVRINWCLRNIIYIDLSFIEELIRLIVVFLKDNLVYFLCNNKTVITIKGKLVKVYFIIVGRFKMNYFVCIKTIKDNRNNENNENNKNNEDRKTRKRKIIDNYISIKFEYEIKNLEFCFLFIIYNLFIVI